MYCYFLLTLLISGFIAPFQAVKIRTFHVPGKASNEAPLLCSYDLEMGKLYDVKWYKDEKQFFRCEPNGLITTYSVEGVQVAHAKFAPLGTCSLTLMMLTSKTSGEYKCEVNTEGPAFETDQERKILTFVEPPELSPKTISNQAAEDHEDKDINYTITGNGSPALKITPHLYGYFLVIIAITL